MVRYVVLISFIFIGIIFTIIFVSHHIRKHEFMGNPPVRKPLFITGKITLFGCWFMMLMKAVIPRIGFFNVPVALMWAAAIVLMLAVIIMSVSFFYLGIALKMGLPNEETQLRTTGIYRYSRNPIYLAVFMTLIASVLYFPDPLNLALAVTAAIIHHKTTKAEEKFLQVRFGKAWSDYVSQTRRYL